ncbi:MAG: hypothetical protein KDB27_04385 [Planctomycetales bacterium]|nr:hypothetical protein [Planctomycetales bacterium]
MDIEDSPHAQYMVDIDRDGDPDFLWIGDDQQGIYWIRNHLPSTPNGHDLNNDGLIDLADLDAICVAVRDNRQEMQFDVDEDGNVGVSDVQHFHDAVLQHVFGDLNSDGLFDSSDLVMLFQKGQYEDDLENNSAWSTGDWNCDGEFDSSDLVIAFQRGTYTR